MPATRQARTSRARSAGRKRIRKRKFKPQTFSNGDTRVELLTRARTILYKSGEKWGKNQKTRAKILFDNYEKLREGYSLICKIRSIFQKNITKGQAKGGTAQLV